MQERPGFLLEPNFHDVYVKSSSVRLIVFISWGRLFILLFYYIRLVLFVILAFGLSDEKYHLIIIFFSD